MKKCFVCMPLIPQLLDVYAAIEEEVKETLGGQWECHKADDTRRPGMVTEKVVQYLLNSDLVIAVVADPRFGNSINPNVMYELGVAHSFRKPAIIVADVSNGLPFDIRAVETIQVDLSSPTGISELRKALQCSLQDPEVLDDLETRRIPRNPITTQLSDTRVFIEDLPWLWGYSDVLKREREAMTIWEITRDLFWPGEALFFESIKEAIRKRRKHYFMVESSDGVLQKVEAVRNELLQEGISKKVLNEFIHFVAIEAKYFVLWPISVVLYDADLATRKGGIICEPMQSQVGVDTYDKYLRGLFVQYAKAGDLDLFQKRVMEIEWTRRRQEATFDISLDGRVVSDLATAFVQLWNEKILDEAQKKTGDEKTALLSTWLIGRLSA